MDDIKTAVSAQSPRFLDRVRWHIRSNGLAYTTEKTYIFCIKRFINFHNRSHLKDMAEPEAE